MTATPRYIDNLESSKLMFSVCSLVKDQEKYNQLLGSFVRRGFTSDNTEFLAADNRTENQFDGYSWHKTLLAEARGRFVIFCHDDVELLEAGFEDLVAALDSLDQMDPSWLLAGVIGGAWHPRQTDTTQIAGLYSDHANEVRKHRKVPSRVETLDECFILMRRLRPVISSYDMGGFHFYGPDLCLQAELLGGSAYAINFHLRHYGHGIRGPVFRDGRRKFVAKYRKYFPDRTLHCTTGKLILAVEPPQDASEE